MKIYWNWVELGWAIFRVNAICLRCVHLFYFAPVCTLGGPPMISDICLVELHSTSPPHLGKSNFSELIWIICAPHLGEEGRTLDSPADTSWLRNPQWGSLVGSRWTLKHFHFLGMCLTDKSIKYFVIKIIIESGLSASGDFWKRRRDRCFGKKDILAEL